MWRKVWECIKALFALVLSAAAIELLHLRGWHPDKWIAEQADELLKVTPTAMQESLIQWSLIFFVAAGMLFIEHWFPVLRRRFWRSQPTGSETFSDMAARVYPYLSSRVPWWKKQLLHRRAQGTHIADDVIERRHIAIVPPFAGHLGEWHGKRFIYHEPLRVFTVHVTDADNEKRHIFEVNGPQPGSFVEFRVVIDAVHGRVKALLDTPRGKIPFDWAGWHPNIRQSFRLPEDRLLALRTAVMADTDLTTIRVFVVSWEL
jgi:hypothetical protein